MVGVSGEEGRAAGARARSPDALTPVRKEPREQDAGREPSRLFLFATLPFFFFFQSPPPPPPRRDVSLPGRRAAVRGAGAESRAQELSGAGGRAGEDQQRQMRVQVPQSAHDPAHRSLQTPSGTCRGKNRTLRGVSSILFSLQLLEVMCQFCSSDCFLFSNQLTDLLFL